MIETKEENHFMVSRHIPSADRCGEDSASFLVKSKYCSDPIDRRTIMSADCRAEFKRARRERAFALAGNEGIGDVTDRALHSFAHCPVGSSTKNAVRLRAGSPSCVVTMSTIVAIRSA